MKPTVSFQALLQRFFTDRLIQQRQASAHTISSYRDTFRLLLRFAHKRLPNTPFSIQAMSLGSHTISVIFTNSLPRLINDFAYDG
jgi:hypothetical protein